ncbi:L-asparaginase / beta-aspartyl-peptidase [Sphingomonas sp. F9_3S_D5_B_2]
MRGDRGGDRWALIIHGGAKEIHPDEEQANRSGLMEAVQAGERVLRSGGGAIDAVEAAIRVLEDLPIFNAGRGSCLNAAGEIEMCSGLMDGRNLGVGAVAGIRNVRNPVSLARHVLSEHEVLLAGEGAMAFAREKGVEFAPDEYLLDTPRAAAEHDTVGAVALDAQGNIAAGTSTGGLPGKRVGRVGDSPIAGAGFYAENAVGGVSLSGDGESIIRVSVAARIMAAMPTLGPDQAALRALEMLPQVGGADGDGGAIVIRSDGSICWQHNSSHFAVALVTSEMDGPGAWLSKEEERHG